MTLHTFTHQDKLNELTSRHENSRAKSQYFKMRRRHVLSRMHHATLKRNCNLLNKN